MFLLAKRTDYVILLNNALYKREYSWTGSFCFSKNSLSQDNRQEKMLGLTGRVAGNLLSTWSQGAVEQASIKWSEFCTCADVRPRPSENSDLSHLSLYGATLGAHGMTDASGKLVGCVHVLLLSSTQCVIIISSLTKCYGNWLNWRTKLGVSPTTKLNKMNALERLNKSNAQRRREENSGIGLGMGETIGKDWKQIVKVQKELSSFVTIWMQSSLGAFKKQKQEIQDDALLI